MRITLSERGTPDWQTAADLARLVFAKQYRASITPDPDGFLAFFETAADGQEEVLACAGLSFPEEETILLERYLDAPVEDVITQAVGAPVKRSQVLQIGSIASVRAAAGAEIIKAIPLIMACLGRPYAVMTMTGRLAALMQRLGCVFHPLADASLERLPADERASWGTYYDTRPVVGYAEAAEQSTLLLAAIGRYCFTSVDMRLLSNRPAQQGVLTRAA